MTNENFEFGYGHPFTAELGQTTYIELISVDEIITAPAIKSTTRNVNLAVNQLAFGKKKTLENLPIAHKKEVSHLVNIGAIQSAKYSPQSLIKTHQIHKNIQTESQFRQLTNNISIQSLDDCAITSDIDCTDSGCPVDVVFVIDNTVSMNAVLPALKVQLLAVAFEFTVFSPNDYRFGLITFKNDVTLALSFPANCSNYGTFTAAINALTADGGGQIPEASDTAIESAIDGLQGLWRESAQKIIILVTDALPGGIDDVYDYTDKIHANEVALKAANCGIKIISVGAIALPTPDQDLYQIMQNYADVTGGIYVISRDCDNIYTLLYTYISRLCGATTLTTHCSGGENIVFNGDFDTGIAGWDIGDVGADVTWDSVRRAAKLSTNASFDPSIEQSHAIVVQDQDVVQVAFDVDNQTDSAVLITCIIGNNTDSQSVPFGKTRLSFTGLVDADDAIFYSITANTPIGQFVYIDNVISCLFRNDDCINGINAIVNGQFLSGVNNWKDSDDVLIADTTSPYVWDDEKFAIIVVTKFFAGHDPAPGFDLVRQLVVGLIPSTVLTLIYDLLELGPDSDSNRGYMASVTDVNGTVLATHTIRNSNVFSYPSRRSLTFTVPSDGKVKVDFQVGLFGGGANVKIRNVRLCVPIGHCSSGTTTISFDNFLTSQGGWQGGLWINGFGYMLVNFGSPISQVFSNLRPNHTLTVFADALQIGGLIIELISGGVTNRITTDIDPGTKSNSIIIQDTGVVLVRISSIRLGINVSNILVCESAIPCSGNITNVRSYVEWKGIPRKPTNIFNILVRYKTRDLFDPFITNTYTNMSESDGHTSIISPSACNTPSTCDFWKQNGQSGNAQNSITNQHLIVSTISDINAGDINIVDNRTNWVWGIPSSIVGNIHDNLVTIYSEPPPGLIESIEFLLLCHTINPSGSLTTPACVGPFNCSPDPASEFDVILRYTNGDGLEREFKVTLNSDNLHNQTVDFTSIAPDTWDKLSAVGNGLKGSSARWESAKFVLDTVTGDGLDQCTVPLSFDAVGIGTFDFKSMIFDSKDNLFLEGCDAEIIVEEMQRGLSINEIQEIILPNPSGGLWTLNFNYDNIDDITELIPWNASSEQVRVKLINLQNIDGAANVQVTGQGTDSNPYEIEFQGDLAGLDVPLLIADGSALTGAATAFVTTLVNGTKNERQTITNVDGTDEDFIIRLSGAVSTSIPSNASLNMVESRLEAMSTIGFGNVSVSGLILERTIPYRGPWHVIFDGDLARQNIPAMSVTNGYEVTVDWNGGSGTNEFQQITIVANDGTFTIELARPGDLVLAITDDISYQASAGDIKSAIVNAASWFDNDDIDVVASETEEENTSIWIVEFKGTYAGTNVPQMKINGSQLIGGPIIVNEKIKGSSTNEIYNISLIKAKGGHFRLLFKNNGEVESTNRIPYNTTASGLQSQILALSMFQSGDVIVEKLISDDQDVTSKFSLEFNRQLGEIDIEPKYEGILFCDPLPLTYVPPGPYPYDLPSCDELEDLSCQSGPLLCVPGIGDGEDLIELCCQSSITESANVSRRLEFQRDLFDPNRTINDRKMVIKDLAQLKGLNFRKYTPYFRDFESQTLRETSYNAGVITQSSVVLIRTEIDSERTRRKVIEHFRAHREILPTRMYWPRNGFVAQ